MVWSTCNHRWLKPDCPEVLNPELVCPEFELSAFIASMSGNWRWPCPHLVHPVTFLTSNYLRLVLQQGRMVKLRVSERWWELCSLSVWWDDSQILHESHCFYEPIRFISLSHCSSFALWSCIEAYIIVFIWYTWYQNLWTKFVTSLWWTDFSNYLNRLRLGC